MKKSINIIIFIVLGIAVIGIGMWFSGNVSNETKNTVTTQGATAKEAQSKIMENLKIEDVVVGTGAEAKNGDTITVNYTGTLDDGTKFDSSLNPGRTPFSFPLGAGQVIKGWDMGVLGMKIGGKRRLIIPSAMAYGSQRAAANIPPNSDLVFDIELIAIK